MISRRSRRAVQSFRSLALRCRVAARAAHAAAWMLACVVVAAATPVRAQTVQVRPSDGTVYRSLADTSRIPSLREALARDPADRARILDLANAQVAARQFREAIATYTAALERTPNDALLLRWRGHRYLAVREFTRARDDLERASDLAPELYGAWFHLGLARFFLADFDAAADAFRKARSLASSPSERAGCVDWLWGALMRAGRGEDADRVLQEPREAAAPADAYERRLALYRGSLSPDAVLSPSDTSSVRRATLAHGVGQWSLIRGDTVSARRWFERSRATDAWPSFGFIAAEVELARLSAR
jgi:tetratricopeptide (TPR) repeat protein